MKRLLSVLGAIALVLLLVGGIGLGLVHRDIRGAGGALPDAVAIAALAAGDHAPVGVRAFNTASQGAPRSTVLAASRDPSPDREYVLGHTAFLLEWADGRRLLVDTGMEPEAAAAFGAPFEWVGADPIEAHGSVAEQLGPEVAGPLAVVFTHLHSDHTQGLLALCEARAGSEITVFQSGAQAEHLNYTTLPGAAHLQGAACARVVVLDGDPLAPIPGFGGVGVGLAAGHTPGSQVVFAGVAGTVHAFTGDVANNVDGIRYDVSKPLAYRLFVVPEDDSRLGLWRRLLGGLEREQGVVLAPAHDQLHLEEIGLLQTRK